VVIVDFSEKLDPHVFTANGDHFYASPVIPKGVLGKMFAMAQQFGKMDLSNLNDPSVIDRLDDELMSLFQSILLPESWNTFRARAESIERPLSFMTRFRILIYLLEQYTKNPTQPVPDSGTQFQETTVVSLTDGVSPVE
jgi:hypothetical protein